MSPVHFLLIPVGACLAALVGTSLAGRLRGRRGQPLAQVDAHHRAMSALTPEPGSPAERRGQPQASTQR